MYWPCRLHTLTENAWQQISYFDLDFESNEVLFLFNISFGEVEQDKNM